MKTFTHFFFLMLLCLCGDEAFSQVKIGDNPTNVNPNSLLELESSSKGLLLPRLTNDQIPTMTICTETNNGRLIKTFAKP